MKINRILLFILTIILFFSCNQGKDSSVTTEAPVLNNGETAEISFREYEHDFGKISEGEKVAHFFVFENKGPGNLIIRSASTSCGCTVPRYDRKPIPPGQSGSMEVVFDSSGRSGKQTKTVSVHTNSKNEVVILKITAEVVE